MKNLLKEEYYCELTTPMFLGGADGTNSHADPEIRPPSIRGGMRWWLRAMMGGLIGNNIDHLKKAEEYVFGSSTKSSSVVVKTTGNPESTEYPRLPHETGRKSARRNAFSPNGIIRVTLSLSPHVRKDEEIIFKCAKYSLLLLLTLGGLGTRSRRGFGSVHLFEERDYQKLISEAQETFKILVTTLELENKDWIDKPSFPCLSKNYFNLWIAESKDTWENSLKNLMRKMSAFKSITEGKNFAFGGVLSNKRQASPLIVHAIKETNGSIKLLFSHFLTSQEKPFEISQLDRENLESYIKEKFNLKKLEVFV